MNGSIRGWPAFGVLTPSRPSARSASRRGWALIGLAALYFDASGQALVDAADRRFMAEAASGGMVEIVLGRVAEERAASDGVRRFGTHMVDDHNKANEELKTIALAKGVPLPTGLTADQKAVVSQMKKRKGAGFDAAYLARMVDDHGHMVALFERAGSSAGDADVKAFAGRYLPTVRTHLQMAQHAAGSKAGAPDRAAAPAKAAAPLPVKPVTRE